MTGALVGINTSILTRSGGSNGIGFAIPADLVGAVLRQARDGNTRFERPWAGMTGQIVDAALAENLSLDHPQGLAIVDLHPQSPFAAAGLGPGDVIVAFNGQAVNGPAELLYLMSVTGIGDAAEVAFVSRGKDRKARVEMIPAPETPPRNTTAIEGQGPLGGLVVSRINPAVITERNLALDAEGVVVISAEGTAARIGFRPGDILVEVNGRPIGTVRDALAAGRDKTRVWELVIERGGQVLSMRFRG